MPLPTKVKTSTQQLTQLAQSSQLATWLNNHVVLGNLAFALLLGYSFYNILGSFFPQIELIGYKQARITTGDMEAVCDDEAFYQEKLKHGYNAREETVEPRGLRYLEDTPENADVYPVFRWYCKYAVRQTLDTSPLIQGEPTGSRVKRYLESGLSLDEYHCQIYHSEEGLTKSTYLNPKDPNSWYCVDATPEL